MKISPVVGMIIVALIAFTVLRGRPNLFKSFESFTQWPGAGVRAQPPIYAVAKENFVSKTCPDGTRSDGPCLLEFPRF